MNHTVRLLLMLLIAFAVSINGGIGAPAANLQLGRLLDQSDAVAIASIEGISLSGSDVVFSLLVVRTIKGGITDGTLLSATWNAGAHQQVGGDITGNRETGLWFLKQNGTAWMVLPIAVGAVPLNGVYIHVPSGPIAPAFAYDTSVGVARRLAYELGAAAQDTGTVVALAHILASGAADDLGANVLLPIWTQLSLSTASITRAIGLAGEIRLGNPTALAVLAGTGQQTMGADAQDHLSVAICRYRTNDTGAVGSLGTLAKSAYAENLTFCAVHALREIHSKEAVKYLIPLLDSTSQRMQYEAVAGVASFANGLPVQTATNTADVGFLAVPSNAPLATADTLKNFPTRSAFEKQRQVYISFWKGWLLAHAIN